MPNHNLNDTDLGSQSIFLHSNDAALSITDSEKIFYLKENIKAPAGTRIIIGLTNLTLPNSMFNVSENTNSITIAVAGGSTNVRTIPVGNYDTDSLSKALKELSEITDCSFNDNNKLNIVFASPSKITESTLSRQLGIKSQVPMSNFVTNFSGAGICDLGGVTNIYIKIRNVTMNNLDSRGQTSNIIASIVNNTNYGGYIFYTPPEVLYYLINENTVSYIDLELTDQEGKLLELNEIDYNLTLTIHFVKQRESITRTSLLKEIKDKYEMKNKDEEKKNDE